MRIGQRVLAALCNSSDDKVLANHQSLAITAAAKIVVRFPSLENELRALNRDLPEPGDSRKCGARGFRGAGCTSSNPVVQQVSRYLDWGSERGKLMDIGHYQTLPPASVWHLCVQIVSRLFNVLPPLTPRLTLATHLPLASCFIFPFVSLSYSFHGRCLQGVEVY
jgi:hypothetical protein